MKTIVILQMYSIWAPIGLFGGFALLCVILYYSSVKKDFKEAQKLNNEKIKIPPPN